MFSLAVASLLLVDSLEAQSPSGRALTIEDYYTIKSIGDAQMSPNGKWVAYTLSTRIEEDNTTSTETYVVDATGAGPSRRITHEGQDVANPRWAEDGLLQYSLTARVPSAVFIGSESPRNPPGGANGRPTWRVSVEPPGAGDPKGSGKPIPVAPAPPGVRSADGRWIAHARDRPRPTLTPAYRTDFEKRHSERFKGRTFDWMRFQQDGQEVPVPDPRLRPAAEIEIAPASGGPAVEVTALGFRPSNLAWHPSGATLAFTADENWKSEQTYENPDIFTVTPEGKVHRVTNDGFVWSSLAYSPDGQFLLAERTFGTGMIIDQKLNHGGSNDLILWPASGPGSPINLTETWDLEPNAPRWSPDSRHIYFTAGVGGATHLFRVAARAGAKVAQITGGERRINTITFDQAMTRIAYTVGTCDGPSEVWTANIDGSGERQLTSAFIALKAEIAVTKTTRLQWRSKDGTPIEGWLTEPYAFDRAKGPYPMVVMNHGGPHAAVGYGFNFKQQYLAAHGYFVFDTNFRGSTGYGDAFKWATWGAWGNKDGEDVVSGLDYVLSNYPVDRSRIATMGHSYGGFMTNWLITTYPDRFAAAASGAGISNWLSDYGTADIYRTKETEFFGPPWEDEAIGRMIAQSPLTRAGRAKTPTLFIHGEVDQRVPYEEAEQMYFALRRQGVPARMVQYAGQPHGISGHWNNVHRMLNELDWFETFLKKKLP
jgi:dipeptidyl aminopeptidase/acylaminoacyl peptidase